MFVVLQQKTTTAVVVLPTLEGAWITDGTLSANGVTMIHWRLHLQGDVG